MKKQGSLWCVPVLVLASACTSSPTEDEMDEWRYGSDVARIEAEEEFESRKERCERSRGTMVVNRQFSRRMQKTPDDVKLATCMPARGGVVF